MMLSGIMGATGEWLTTFGTALRDKLAAMSFQVDFGNLAVGMATIILAVLSFRTAMQNIVASRMIAKDALNAGGRRAIAEARLQWNESLRDDVAKFLSYTSHPTEIFSPEKVRELSELYNRVRLRLQKQKHSREIDAMHNILLEVSKGSVSDIPGLLRMREILTDMFEILLEEAWERANKEMLELS